MLAGVTLECLTNATEDMRQSPLRASAAGVAFSFVTFVASESGGWYFVCAVLSGGYVWCAAAYRFCRSVTKESRQPYCYHPGRLCSVTELSFSPAALCGAGWAVPSGADWAVPSGADRAVPSDGCVAVFLCRSVEKSAGSVQRGPCRPWRGWLTVISLVPVNQPGRSAACRPDSPCSPYLPA